MKNPKFWHVLLIDALLMLSVVGLPIPFLLAWANLTRTTTIKPIRVVKEWEDPSFPGGTRIEMKRKFKRTPASLGEIQIYRKRGWMHVSAILVIGLTIAIVLIWKN